MDNNAFKLLKINNEKKEREKFKKNCEIVMPIKFQLIGFMVFPIIAKHSIAYIKKVIKTIRTDYDERKHFFTSCRKEQCMRHSDNINHPHHDSERERESTMRIHIKHIKCPNHPTKKIVMCVG